MNKLNLFFLSLLLTGPLLSVYGCAGGGGSLVRRSSVDNAQNKLSEAQISEGANNAGGGAAQLEPQHALFSNTDALTKIAEHLSMADLLRMQTTCKALKEAADNLAVFLELHKLLLKTQPSSHPEQIELDDFDDDEPKCIFFGDYTGENITIKEMKKWLVKAKSNTEYYSDSINDILIEALKQGYTNSINILLPDNIKTNDPLGLNKTLIHAICCDRTEAINMLLNKGANPDATNKYGDTALMLAAKFGSTEIVNALVSAGTNINTINPDNHRTALIWAAQLGTSREDVMDIFRAGYMGNNPFCRISPKCASKHIEIVNILLNAGADIPTDIDWEHTWYPEITRKIIKTKKEAGADGAK